MEMKNNKYLNFYQEEKFICFSMKEPITTYDNKGKESKKVCFPVGWEMFDNYSHFDVNHQTVFIQTGERSNITVVDIDDKKIYDDLLKTHPDLEDCYTVETNKGYHIYFKYIKSLKQTTNINGIKGIDIRNDRGCVIAPPTKYKLLNGEIAKYKYLGGEILDIPTSLLNLFTVKNKIVKKGIKEERKEFHNDIKTKEIVKLINCLDCSKAEDYDSWIKIGMILYNELKEEGRLIFHKFSQVCEEKYDEDETNKKYDSFSTNKEDKLTIGTLKFLAKEDNPEKYDELYKSSNASIKSTFTMLEKDIAEYVISNVLKNDFVCTETKPAEFYYFNGNTWVLDTKNQKILKMIYDDLIKEYESLIITTTNEDEKEIIRNIIIKLKGKLCFINSIIEWIAILTLNVNFFEIVDENPDLLAFDNGIYEIKTKTFREGKREDYITKTTGYDFPSEKDKDYGHKEDIEKFLKQVFPDEEVRNFVIQTQAQALSGRKTEDLIYTHTGRGGNGKTILIEILKNVFGGYFLNIPVSMLTKANNKGHNDPDPYMGRWKGVRYGMANEPKDGASFNDSLIKNIGSQESLEYRMLYSNKVLELHPQLKLNIYCNNKLRFNADDGGIGRRMCVVDYISKFAEEVDEANNIYLIDSELSHKVKDWKKDYMRLLLNLHQNNYKHNPPASVVKSSRMYIDENNDVLKFVNEFYEKTNNNNDFITLKDIKMEYQNNKQYEQTKLKNLKESLEKIFNTNFIEDKKIKGRKYRSVILGWKLKRELDDDDDDDDDNDEKKSPLD